LNKKLPIGAPNIALMHLYRVSERERERGHTDTHTRTRASVSERIAEREG